MLLALVGDARAQEPSVSALAAFERSARDGDLVRVTTSAGLSFEGHVAEVGADAVLVDAARVPLVDVVRIERGDPSAGGARAGMLGGAVILGTLFVVVSYAVSDDPDFEVSAAGPIALAGIVAGGILGGLVGAELDPPRVDWREIWPVAVSW